MPTSLVSIIAEQQGISFEEASKRWSKAKAIARDETGMSEDDGEPFWKYTTGVFKKSMGISSIHESAASAEIHSAAHKAATSHKNDLPQPTDAQKKAGNYKHGKISLYGMPISIENPKGSQRSGIDPNGEPWSVTMPAIYGYFLGTEGADGDHVDCYIGDHPDSQRVFVVDQLDADTGAFDEHKIWLGVRSAEETQSLYCTGFSDGRGLERIGAITELTVDAFRGWLRDGDTGIPMCSAIALAETK